jgi:SAM-dependent methyltransferase
MDDAQIIATLKEAMALHLDERFMEAQERYQAVLAAVPDHPDALHLLGVLFLQNGMNGPGAAMIERAITLRPPYSEARQNLASFMGDTITTKWQAESDQLSGEDRTWSPVIEGQIDDWRHMRMLEFATCLAGTDDTWLTVGDAFGHDQIRLRRHGIRNVVSSNLNTTPLRLGHEAGFVGDYLEINAEAIDLPSGSYDYVLCKEALHHMPRPSVAIYEMLRVARKAVFLVEPQDPVIDLPRRKDDPNWYAVEGNRITTGRRGQDQPLGHFFVDWVEEGAGNYVYTLSKREIEKLSYGLGLLAFGWKSFNDHYDPALAELPSTPGSEGMTTMTTQISLMDQVAAAGIRPYNYLAGVLFKHHPPQTLIQGLHDQGFTLNRTPTRMLAIRWPRIG